jgi:two-component system cell cycle response regulator CtrA
VNTQGLADRALTRRIAELEEENEELREKVGAFLGKVAAETAAFPVSWGLSPTEARILGVLMIREWATRDQLFVAIKAGGRPSYLLQVISVHICRLRKKLAPLGARIDVRWGYGYEISAANKRIIRAAIEAAR